MGKEGNHYELIIDQARTAEDLRQMVKTERIFITSIMPQIICINYNFRVITI